MQQELTWAGPGQPRARPSSPSSSSSTSSSSGAGGGGGVRAAVEETPVVVVGRRECCMGHVVKLLLQGLGANPAVWEVDGDVEEAAVRAELSGERGGAWPATLPAVFIGGRLVGGLDHVVAAHISGDLVPILKEAGALWL
ncbi:Glutaredoxin-C9 [Apostasia shenzhenica]|uniref:Glutaredoxin-C9 n=1 Tax=Apostasia shenzhenica TaxID=1088818 RepID=A0A2I0A272_9ASPA|nr:Glutaredoxin-C9 [Apostasia shenzhenica]